MTRGLPVLALAALAACIQTQVNVQKQGATTGAGATAGTTGGSTTGGSGLDGGACTFDRTSSQGDDCDPTYPCGCPFVCTSDSLESQVEGHVGSYVCEQQCQSNADCPTTDIACVGGACGAVPCGGGAGNGLFGAVCAMGSIPESGTCIPIPWQSFGIDAGVCMQGGTATTACNSLANERSQLDQVCVPGFVCNGSVGDAGLCLRACDSDDGCPAGEYCFAAALTPTDGVCLDAGS